MLLLLMGLARGHGPAHEPIPESGFAGESNVAIFFVPGIKDFAELQSSEACFLQTTTQLEGIVEFLAMSSAFCIEPRNKVVAPLPACPSLSASAALVLRCRISGALPVQNESAFIATRIPSRERSSSEICRLA